MQYTDKIYGIFELSGIIEELIETKVFQRLKKIHQGGAIVLVKPEINQTRFEHSIGVMLLIKQLGGNVKEQIAGLIHDISHTAFSHLVDYVLEIETEDYHEQRYETVLKNEEFENIFLKNGFNINDFIDLEQFKMLEYPLPNLSADRIDYTLRDLFQLGVITKQEIDWFLNGLVIFENRIVVKSVAYAEWFQSKYQYLITDYFNSTENRQINLIMKSIIQECLQKGIIKEEDFHQDDFYLIEKLENAINLKQKINTLQNQNSVQKVLKTKQRRINPEILVNDQIIRLSELR